MRPALVMMKFPPAELENCMTFPVVLEPMTVRTFAAAEGVPLAVIDGTLSTGRLLTDPMVRVSFESYIVSIYLRLGF